MKTHVLIDPTNDVCVFVCLCVSSLFQEVAEPLQDLKEGMEQLEKNKTLRYILSTLLSFGNFLNNTSVSHDRYMFILVANKDRFPLSPFSAAVIASDYRGPL